jgi:hypothetical protein
VTLGDHHGQQPTFNRSPGRKRAPSQHTTLPCPLLGGRCCADQRQGHGGMVEEVGEVATGGNREATKRAAQTETG